jgi:predicted outer membrane protein
MMMGRCTIPGMTMLVAAVAAVAPGLGAQAPEDRAAHAFVSAVDAGEIQQGMLAQERAMDPAVRMFAVTMATEHSNALMSREMRMAQLGMGLGLDGDAWTGNEGRWAMGSGAMPMSGVRGGMAAQGTQGQSPAPAAQPMQGRPGMASGPGAQGGQAVAPSAQPTPAQPQPQPMAGHGAMREPETAHNAMAAGPGWSGATLRYAGVLTPAGMRELHDALMENPVSRPVAEAGMRDMQMLSQLDGQRFDVGYMEAQLTAHRYALENLDRMIQRGGVSPEVLGTLMATRSSVASHLEMAQEIRARLR